MYFAALCSARVMAFRVYATTMHNLTFLIDRPRMACNQALQTSKRNQHRSWCVN
jgi:hypothetical protein